MKAGISVELDGTVFTLEERAYDALRAYLDRAGARLGGHPDRTEVIAGLERSIAAKLRKRRQGEATIDEAAMQAALQEVGRVDGPALDDSALRDSRGYGPPPRRLYRIREGQQFAGVCTGLAAFAGIDVNVIRIVFILATLFSGGTLALVYVALMFVMPIADRENASSGDGDWRK